MTEAAGKPSRRVENVWKTVKAGTIKGGDSGITLQASE